MVDFIRKRLQVFVSSTFSDLREERQAAVEAILSAGHIPAGMELFSAGDESQMEVIKQWIDESDVYLLILGGRYGSIDPKSGKSYTQLEYEYAIETSKPFFACVIKEEAIESRVQKYGLEMIDKNQKELDAFRTIVQNKIVEFWEDTKDIKLAIINKLGQLSRRDDLVGWVRANQQANLPALSDEMARLSKENAELRDRLGSKSEASIHGLSYIQLKKLLQKKELWNFVKKHKGEMRKGIKISPETEALVELGLMKWVGNPFNPFFPTEAGLMLLNNIEFEDLGELI